MPGTPTTKWSLPTIAPALDIVAGSPTGTLNPALADIDALLTPNNIGVLASRPAYGKAGQTYLATDATTGVGTSGNVHGTLFLDIGSAWIPISYEGAQTYWRILFNTAVNWPTSANQVASFIASGSDPLRLLHGATLPALVGATAPPGMVQVSVPGVYRISTSLTIQQSSSTTEEWADGIAALAIDTAASGYSGAIDLAVDSIVGSGITAPSFTLNVTDTIRLALNDYVCVKVVAIPQTGSTTFNITGSFTGEWIAP
jgi:hypothetical protein